MKVDDDNDVMVLGLDAKEEGEDEMMRNALRRRDSLEMLAGMCQRLRKTHMMRMIMWKV